jgi:methyl-accepting chemotaxis protein
MIAKVSIIASVIVDLNVRQRLARMRRNFLTLGWTSRDTSERPSTEEPDRDLILEDNIAAYRGIESSTGVDWRNENPGLFDDAAIAWSPSPQTRAAVFSLAEKIRTEAKELAKLSDRARDMAHRLVREHESASADARDLLTRMREEDATVEEDHEAIHVADWDAHFASLNELVREIGTTALRAALSGVRAGASTRGFSHVAKGVDELERALRSSWDEIESLISDLEDRAAETAATAAALRSAGKSVAVNTAELPQGAIGSGGEPASSDRLNSLGQLTDKIARTGGEVAEACDSMADLVNRLAERLMIVVRETPVGDRRAAKRIAFQSSCILSTSDRSFAGTSLDLSATGALVKLRQEPNLQRAQPITLHLKDIAPIVGSVAAVSAQGVHIAFDLGHGANAAARPALMQMLDALLTRSQDLVTRTTRLARDIRTAMELGLDEHRVTQADLLSVEYLPIDGTVPAQFTHAALDFHDEVLPPLLAEAYSDTPNVLYAVAVDRSGFVPVDKRPGAGGPKIGPRHRRLFTDFPSQRTARNLRPFLIQVGPLDPAAGERSETVRSVSVPIFVGGRHWGCAEIGFSLEDGDAALTTIGV